MTNKRQAAPPGVPTRARLHLLGEVERGHVMWLIGPMVAQWRTPDGALLDMTNLFRELQAAAWARVTPWDDDEEPPPQITPCVITRAGEHVLAEAARAARRRKAAKR